MTEGQRGDYEALGEAWKAGTEALRKAGENLLKEWKRSLAPKEEEPATATAEPIADPETWFFETHRLAFGSEQQLLIPANGPEGGVAGVVALSSDPLAESRPHLISWSKLHTPKTLRTFTIVRSFVPFRVTPPHGNWRLIGSLAVREETIHVLELLP